MWFNRFKQIVLFLILPFSLAVVIQTAGRLYLITSYQHTNLIPFIAKEIGKLLIIGLRFDIRSATIGCSILLFFSLFTLFSPRGFLRGTRYLLYLTIGIVMLFLLITMVNIFYVITYNRYINVFIFGLFEDDTSAILSTIWHDYPIITILLIFITTMLCCYYLLKNWLQFSLHQFIDKPTRYIFSALQLIVIISLIIIGCRGSLSFFPLRENDVQISRYPLINQLAPNGIIALDWAYKNYRYDSEFKTVSDDVRDNLITTFFPHAKTDTLAIFDQKTAENPTAKKRPPHVIFTVMESMGTHLFMFDNKQRDLLADLRPHWQNDWLFTRFISEGDGTIDTLNRFFVRSPINNISQSSAQYTDFKSNMFSPFLAQGYKIIFITTGKGSWRNLNQFLLHLGVTEFIEENTLKQLYPEAPENVWGLPDEYMFRYAKQRLIQAEEQNEHVMIMMMSITNHPPYAVPEDYPFINYDISQRELQRLKNFGSKKDIIAMFNTFRYANQQLGKFIHWVKQQPFYSHTIIAATGDHNVRGIGYSKNEEQALSHAVPFYLMVPTSYQTNSYYNPKRVGSHKDVLPTLYSLALSETKYYQTGCDLLAKKQNPTWCGAGYNPEIVIDDQGGYLLRQGEFRPWQDKDNLLLANATPATPQQQKTFIHWNTFTKLLQWQITEQIKNKIH